MLRWVGWSHIFGLGALDGCCQLGCSGLQLPQPGPCFCLQKVSVNTRNVL